jgi:hypothetical protein
MLRIVLSLWFYLLVYVVVAGGFAIGFSFMPGQFYHSTIEYEPETKQYKKRVQEGLEANIKRNITGDPSNDATIGSWTIPTVYISDLVLRDEWLIARTYIYGIEKTSSPLKRFEATFNLKVSSGASVNTPLYKPVRDENGQITASTAHPIYYVRKAEITDFDAKVDGVSGLPVKTSDLFPCRSYPGSNPLCIEADNYVDRDIGSLVRLLSGQPDSGWDNFLRMLYFSVVTITTVGFGDIVPVTRLSRGLVTFEAFLGPVILGFFLNAVARRFSPAGKSRQRT